MKKLNMVLLIDDNDADNEFHQIVIKGAKITMELKTISDSFEALDYFKHALASTNGQSVDVPNLVFLDINMPAMNGFEFLEELRKIPDPEGKRNGMKIFMLTGSLNPDDYNMATEKFGDLISGFRIKPLTETIFLDIVQRNF